MFQSKKPSVRWVAAVCTPWDPDVNNHVKAYGWGFWKGQTDNITHHKRSFLTSGVLTLLSVLPFTSPLLSHSYRSEERPRQQNPRATVMTTMMKWKWAQWHSKYSRVPLEKHHIPYQQILALSKPHTVARHSDQVLREGGILNTQLYNVLFMYAHYIYFK